MTQSERVRRYIAAHPLVSTMELQLALRPFVSNPRARISDLRAAGIDVACVARTDGQRGYVIKERRPVTQGEQQAMAL